MAVGWAGKLILILHFIVDDLRFILSKKSSLFKLDFFVSNICFLCSPDHQTLQAAHPKLLIQVINLLNIFQYILEINFQVD